MQHYFCDAWNTFDALIVVGSIVDIAITEVHVSTWRLEPAVQACFTLICLSLLYFCPFLFFLPTSLFLFHFVCVCLNWFKRFFFLLLCFKVFILFFFFLTFGTH
jgi:hypothetical protein